jgi:hypothetical protein
MPQTENDKTVELDVTGPGATIELPEVENENDKTYDNEVKKNEPNITYDNEPDNTPEKPDEQPVLRDDKNDGGEVVQKTSEDGGDKQKDNSKDVEEYSEGVKKRIAKLTKKMREAERQKDEAMSYAHRIKGERDRYEATATGLDRNYASEMEGRITSSLSAAQAKLSSARLNEDSKAEVEALTSISQLGYEQAKLAEIKSQHAMQDSAANEKPTLQQQPARQPAPVKDPKAEAWADENDWFGKDNAMTYTAFDLHRKLTEEEGMDPQSDEYYLEVDKRIRLEFPHKFGKVEQQISKPTQNVASATRSSKTGRKTVRLTPTQVTIAKKLGVPLEEYAKQLIITKEV